MKNILLLIGVLISILIIRHYDNVTIKIFAATLSVFLSALILNNLINFLFFRKNKW
jgi:hypothetical protein